MAGVATLCCLLSQQSVFFFCSLLFVANTIVLLISKKSKFLLPVTLAFLLCIVFISSFFMFYNRNIKYLEKLNGKEAIIYGQVVERPIKTDSYAAYTVNVERINGRKVEKEFKTVCFTFDIDNIDYTDYVAVDVEFDKKYDLSDMYSRTNGIFINNKTSNVRFVKNGKERNLLKRASGFVKDKVEGLINNTVGRNEHGIIEALTVGDSADLGSKTREIFSRCGISHMLAISGIHLSILFFSLYQILMFLKVNGRLSALISCLSAGFYAVLTGFSTSIVRALIAFVIVMLGRMLYIKTDTLNSLGCSVIIIVSANPYAVCDYGFVMSVVSLLGLSVLSDDLTNLLTVRFKNKILRSISRKTVSVFSQSFAATVFLFPVLALFFGRVPLLSPIINIIAYYPVILIMLLSFFGILIGFVPFVGIIGRFSLFLAGVVTKYTVLVLKYISEFEFVSTKISFSFISAALAAVFVIMAILLMVFNERLPKTAMILGALCVLLVSAIIPAVNKPREIAIVRNSFCNIIVDEKLCVVIGAGKNKSDVNKLDDYLSSIGVNRINLLIIPNNRLDVSGGTMYLADKYDCDTVVTDKEFDVDKYFDKKTVDINGSSIKLKDGFKIDFYRQTEDDYAVVVNINNTNFVFSYNDYKPNGQYVSANNGDANLYNSVIGKSNKTVYKNFGSDGVLKYSLGKNL